MITFFRFARFLRLSDDSSMEALHCLLLDHWHAFASSGAAAPNLVLNFLGGEDFQGVGVAERLSAASAQLVEVWSSVNAVLVTRGVDAGITKVMTDAFVSGKKVLSGMKKKICCHYIPRINKKSLSPRT